MAVRVVVSGTHLYFVQCLRNLIKNLKPYSIQFNDGCYCKLQSKTAQGVGEEECQGARLSLKAK